MFVIGAGSTQVSLTLPEHLDAGHVDFARQLASQAWAYAVAVDAATGACRRCPTRRSVHPTRDAEALLDEPGGPTWCRCPAGRR